MHYLSPESGQVFVDATVGGGGHLRMLLDAVAPKGMVIGLDKDRDAIKETASKLGNNGLRLFRRDFGEVEQVLGRLGIEGVNGILADLGISSHQVDTPRRGFSFNLDGPLDMRMDRESEGPTAADLVANLPAHDLARIFREFGEEPGAVRAARAIVKARRVKPILTTKDLALLLASVLHRPGGTRHPATRCFQALRIAVNHELESLQTFLDSLPRVLLPGGTAVVISYHSLEDRMVKTAFNRLEGKCTCPPGLPECVCGARRIGNILTKKVVRPDPEEVTRNRRSRSARLRAFKRAVRDRRN